MLSDSEPMAEVPDSDLFESEPRAIRDTFRYWNRLRGDRLMPTRSELDVVCEIPHCVANLFLVDVQPARPRFVVRLAGTQVEAQLGFTKGHSIEDVKAGPELSSILEQYERAFETRRPVLCEHSWTRPDDNPVRYRRVLLPLGEQGLVTSFLGCVSFSAWEDDFPKRRLI
jgi:hypothetical protein